MRSIARAPESCRPSDAPTPSAVPTGIDPRNPAAGIGAWKDLAAEISRARRAAGHHPAQAAQLLQSWMSADD